MVLLSGFFISCVNEEELHNDIDYQGNRVAISSTGLSEIHLIEVSGNIYVEENESQGQLRVEGRENLQNVLEINNSSDELKIRGKGSGTESINVDLFLHPDDIYCIVTKGKSKVKFTSTPVLDYLELVTEGTSELMMEEMQVRSLKSRREGTSKMFLSSQIPPPDQDSIYFVAEDVQIVEDRYILYSEEDEDYILSAPVIRTSEDSVFAIGKEMRRFFLTRSHDLQNEGTSYLDALYLPTLEIISKNEGNSESKVWALHLLDVHGEGNSSLIYKGVPDVQERLEGNASIERLP